MDFQDRKTVEEIFANGDLPVLCKFIFHDLYSVSLGVTRNVREIKSQLVCNARC